MDPSSNPFAPDPATVLLCEGDRDLRLALTSLLERAGHRALCVSDARAALSAAIATSPACIVLDLPLPGAEAAEVLRMLRGLSRAREVPVVLIAAPDLPVDRSAGLRPDVDQRLPPTVRPEVLLKAVARAVTLAGSLLEAQRGAVQGLECRADALYGP